MPHATNLRLPPGGKFEIEFTAGVWTDVTTDVDVNAGSCSMRFGRSSQFSQAQVATFDVTLRNFNGQYMPQSAGSPYYPNIVPRKRIRYSYNPGTQRFRFTGYIKQWQPLLNGALAYMQISATCRMDQLSRVTMLSPIRQEITLDGPKLWWPLTDDQGSTAAVEQSGNLGPPLAVVGTTLNPLTFGSTGPGFGDGTGVNFTGGQNLVGNVPNLLNPIASQPFTFEAWAQTGSATDQTPVAMTDTAGSMSCSVTIAGASTGKPSFNLSGHTSITGSTSVIDGQWHHYLVDYDGGGTWTFYVDGNSVGTISATHSTLNLITVGQMTGNIGHLAVYSHGVTAFDTSRIIQHTAAGKGYAGDRTDVRISRFLGFAELGDIGILDFGAALVNTYSQDGKDVVSGCQDMATTEGGGAVFYITPDGRPRFANRRYRDNRTPTLTINAVNDLDPSVYQPSLDDLNLVTRVTVNRSSQAGTLTSQTYDSGAADVFASDVTTYTMGPADGSVTADSDALALAQYIVSLQATSALRYPQIAIDLATSGANLYDQVGQLQIGDRIRLTNIPPNAYPMSQLDFFLEGWTETPGTDSYKFVMDVTAADIPGPRAVVDVSVVDGTDVAAL